MTIYWHPEVERAALELRQAGLRRMEAQYRAINEVLDARLTELRKERRDHEQVEYAIAMATGSK